MRATGTLLAAIVVFGAAGTAFAQTSIGGLDLEGTVEAGGRFFLTDDPSKTRKGKFEEYRDIDEGPFLNRLQLRFFTPDEGYSAQLAGAKWGQSDQEFALGAGRLGLWKFEFDWDQTPHIYSTTARTPAHEISRGVWALPPGLTSLRQFNTSRELDAVGVRWDTGRAKFTLTPTPDLDITAEYTRIHKEGDRPLSMVFGSPGNNYIELLEPIDQTIHDLRVGVAWAHQNWQVQASYHLSLFENDHTRVMFDNPCPIVGVAGGCTAGDSGAAAPRRGQSALAPDNVAHTIDIAGGVNLPLRTRVTGNFAWTLGLQNQAFLAQTINPAIAGVSPLPQKSLNGEVQTFLVNLNATSRPLPLPLTLTGKYRLYAYEDNSDTITLQNWVLSDRTLEAAPNRATRPSFSRHNADFDARYRIMEPLAVTLGTGWERWVRDGEREVRESDEVYAKAAVDATPFDWLLARITYKPSVRRSQHYKHNVADIAAAEGNMFLARKYDEADRDRQQADLMLQFTPFETLTISTTGGLHHDDYVHTLYGLQYDNGWSAGVDLSWAPSERASFTAGYVRESNERKLHARANRASNRFDWISNMIDTNDTFHAGVKVGLIPRVLEWTVDGNYALGLTEILNRNRSGQTPPTTASRVKRWPAFDNDFLRLDTALSYHFLKAWTASLGYAYESFQKHDWRTDTLTPYVGRATDVIFLGNDYRDYTAHILGITIAYTFK